MTQTNNSLSPFGLTVPVATPDAGMTPEVALARLPHETSLAYQAFLDYARMGSARSLSSLLAVYKQRAEDLALGRPAEHPVTLQFRTISRWSSPQGHNWVERVRRYDQAIAEADEQALVEYRLSWRKRRMRLLDALADKLERAIELLDPGRLAISIANGSDGIASVRSFLAEVKMELDPPAGKKAVPEEGGLLAVQGGADIFTRAESLLMLAYRRTTNTESKQGETLDVDQS